ncbi:hypothetical protein HPB49_012769 [Dermacentor silvarum]|uniref:Uncharacterized protein n=1 Tax=Dermacentor silvarum TaxID=543639 RepID=A0ACB8C9B3_DERSI|nr:hypothetical protein HPB49_012769 [Dermacentor silvarum]
MWSKFSLTLIRGGRMPPLPKEEAKIIVRPRGGLCISKVGPTAVADAIWQAAGLDSATRDTDTMCPNFQQNIMVISTPNRNNAARYVGISGISPGKHRLNADLAAAAPGPGIDPGLVDAPGAAPSPGPGRDPGCRYKSRSRSGSRGRQGSRAQPSSGPQSASTGCGRQPTLVWADLVRPKPGANTGAAPAPRNDPPPEQARDAEVIRLRKENDDLKNTINRLVNEMAEIKKLVSYASGNDAAVRASETPIPAPVEDSLKQVAPSVTFLTDSVRQIQVALGDPKRGLGALADRIDAIEARMASSATVVQPLLREARLKYPTSAPTEGPILCAALTVPLGGSPSGQPNNG